VGLFLVQTFSLPKTSNAANSGCAVFFETANQSFTPQKSYTELTIYVFIARHLYKMQLDLLKNIFLSSPADQTAPGRWSVDRVFS